MLHDSGKMFQFILFKRALFDNGMGSYIIMVITVMFKESPITQTNIVDKKFLFFNYLSSIFSAILK